MWNNISHRGRGAREKREGKGELNIRCREEGIEENKRLDIRCERRDERKRKRSHSYESGRNEESVGE